MKKARKARRAREEVEEGHGNSERWLLTYADMITLLMVFFIVLFAISQTDLAKFKALKAGLDKSLSNENPTIALAGGSGLLEHHVKGNSEKELETAAEALAEKKQHEKDVKQEQEALEAVQKEIEAKLGASGLGGSVKFRLEQRGLIVTVVTDQVLFDLGSAELRPDGRRVLDGLAGALAGLPNPTTVEGHTDDRPIRGGTFASNWELSTSRATSVLRYMQEVHGLPANRLAAAGYADQHPIAPNDTEEHRALNRRVEIVVLSNTDIAGDLPVN